MRVLSSRILVVLATILLALGALAGVANREVLDAGRFSAHVDAVRTDSHVSQLIGAEISQRVIQLDENLVALRPAVDSAIGQLVRSSVFTPIVQATARQLHAALTHAGSDQILLRVADIGAVVVAALKTYAPDIADHLPAEFDVTLASVGGQAFAAGTLRLTRLVALFDWLLPLIAAILLGLALWLSRNRRRALSTIGLVIASAGVLVGICYAIVTAFASAADLQSIRGALFNASWNQLDSAVFRSAVVMVVIGWVIFATSRAYLPQWSIGAYQQRVVGWLRTPGESTLSQIVAALALVVIAVFALYRPLATARVIVELLAVAVLAEAVARIARLSADRLGAGEDAAGSGVAHRRSRTWVAVAPALVAVVGLLAFVVVSSLPVNRAVAVSAPVSTTDPNACNGYVALCSRPYNDVSYPTTHNSMSAADEPGWFIPEQPTGLVGQLNAGVTTLLIDSWYGQETSRKGLIANAGPTIDEAFAQADAEWGSSVVRSALRLRSALNLIGRGPAEPYLCHTVCALGATPMLSALKGVRQWMTAHPRVVITFIIEDYISAADTAKVIQKAGLMPFVHTQVPGTPWPTLEQMIDSGQRLQVFDQSNPGGAANPWLLKAFEWIQDTPYDNASQSALSCRLLRGKASYSLFLINNIITKFHTRVSDSSRLNAFSTLLPYAQKCQKERGLLPNFVAVDFYDKGNVFAVVDSLNGVS